LQKGHGSEQEHTASRDKIRLVVEGLTLFFVIFYAGVAAFQLALTKDTAQKQLSAYVFAKEVSIVGGGGDTDYLINVTLKNSGQTPARKINVARIGVYQAPPGTLVTSIEDGAPNHPDAPQGSIPPSEGHAVLVPIPRSYVDDIRAETHSVVIFGDINYSDIFGNQHITQFCQSQNLLVKANDKHPESFLFGNCLVHNCDDDDCKVNK
jgi:hypothetical protein